MQKLTSLFLIIVFLIFLAIGILIGGFFPGGDRTVTPTVEETVITVIPTRTILVLGVNNFVDEEIFLESAWKVTIHQSYRRGVSYFDVVLESLYPVHSNPETYSNPDPYLTAHDPILFPRAYFENLKLFAPLYTIPAVNCSEFFFEEVIVIDEYAMNFLIELTKANPTLSPPPPTVETFQKPWDNPQASHDLQHETLITLCSPTLNILREDNFARVFDLIPEHFKTTISVEDIINFWWDNFDLPSPPSVNCQIFP
jgi:hypothetical protein